MIYQFGPRAQKLANHGELSLLRKLSTVFLKYNISVDNNDIDLLSFMRGKQNEIRNAIRLNTQFQPQKAQFLVKIELTKPANG